VKKILIVLLLLASGIVRAQTSSPEQLYQKLRDRVFAVKDYRADVIMNIQVSFMKIPQLRGKLYFKSPDKLKLVREGGLSILPQRTVNMSLAGLLPEGAVTVIDGGRETLNGAPVRVLKVVPEQDGGDIVLTKLWVDESQLLIHRSEATTRDNGTYLMDLKFGKYATYALPDEIQLRMDVKDYKMPKGVTMDYEGEAVAKPEAAAGKGKRKKGVIRIRYDQYQINTGIDDAFFRDKKKS
jgi:outer membrane lipoprotein-sorting protein